jgi:oligopeptide/dipeptide ABC transporter ATP-binding protein
MVLKQIKKYFPLTERYTFRSKVAAYVKAVDGVSLTIPEQSTVGLVGESGCGKTTTAKIAAGLISPDSGTVEFMGADLDTMLSDPRHAKEFRRNVQLVYQNPYSSLDPMMTVGDIVKEPLIIHGLADGDALDEAMYSLLKKVNLEEYHALRYPHELSGGQRQRVCIARALATQPRLVLLDEPVSSLDLSIRAQILNLLVDLKEKEKLSYLYISHDLATVRQMCDYVAVMYLGRIVEYAATDELFGNPMHPYTQALLSAIPIPDPKVRRKRIVLEGDVPNPVNPPPGCRFHTRCPYANNVCKEQDQALIEVGTQHLVACWMAPTGAIPTYTLSAGG